MKMAKLLLVFFFFSALHMVSFCQKKDTAIIMKNSIKYKPSQTDSTVKKDSLAKKKHDPTKATLYSTIFPGVGQFYNKKYWKLPLVYAAVGIAAYEFVSNRSYYNKYRYALSVVTTGQYNTNPAAVNKIDPHILQGIQFLYSSGADSSYVVSELMVIRNQYRQWEDYSVLFFLLFYALQIVDATVDAHLKDFNVNSDLSLRIAPSSATGPGSTGLSLLFDIHRPKPKPIFDISQ
jgi:hypothetical protein